MTINQFEYDSILDKCCQLPPARWRYLVKGYLTNLFLAVLDFQMHNVAVEKAIAYYKDSHRDEIRNLNDLWLLLSSHVSAGGGEFYFALFGDSIPALYKRSPKKDARIFQ